jgi:glucose/mannose-6-phosphate isomerase
MQKHPVYRIPSTGKTDLARMWSLILLGDYISAYSAILKNVDPTPIDPIIQLKNGTKKI